MVELLESISPMNYTLTDHDVRMFIQEAPLFPRIRRAVPYMAGIIAATVLVAGGVYAYGPNRTVISEAPVATVTTATTSAPIADPTPTPVQAAAVLSTPTPTPAPTATPLPVTIANNSISAIKVVSAPIIWDVGASEAEMDSALQKGVIHLAGTPLPGQKGMVAIAGHSSNYVWAKGDFNSIFAPLTKVKAGQVFDINYNGTMYRYQVSKVYEVNPSDANVLNDNSKTGIRLITCTPVGTSLRRLIVEADQIFPDPNITAPFNGSTFNGTLPGDQS